MYEDASDAMAINLENSYYGTNTLPLKKSDELFITDSILDSLALHQIIKKPAIVIKNSEIFLQFLYELIDLPHYTLY